MNLANLSALFLLGLIPVIILLHSLRSRRREVKVSALFLWEQALKEKRANFRLRKIINNIPLILQIIAAAALILGLAKPFLVREVTNREGNVVLVVDSSASMKAVGRGGDRFRQAKEEALERIETLGRDSKMLIIEAGPKPILRTFFTQDKGALKEAMEQIEVTDAPGAIEAALAMALSFTNQTREDQIDLISDGAYEAISDIEFGRVKVNFIKIDGGVDNVGVTRFEFRRKINYADQYEIMATVNNFTDKEVVTNLELSIDNQPILNRDLILEGRKQIISVFPYSGLIAGVAKAEIDYDDDFAVDNVAHTVLSQSRDIWVLLISEGNFFIESLLAAYPNVRVNKMNQVVLSSLDQQIEGHDIVIFDGLEPPTLDKGNFLLVNTLSPGLPFSSIGQVDNPTILDWENDDPILSSVDLRDLNVTQAIQVEGEGGKALLNARETALIYSLQDDGLRLVYIGFDLLKSDLPLRVAFPVMIGNIFNWLYPNKLDFSSQQVRAGENYPVYFETGVEEITVTAPDGEASILSVRDNPYLYENTLKAGLYSVEAGGDDFDFAVNLVSSSESDIAPRDHTFKGGQDEEEGQLGITKAENSIWPYFALGAFILLLGEWYFWSRGK